MATALEDLLSSLDKTIGANDEAQAVTKFIDTGYPPLNYAMSGRYNGGLPFGRMVEIFGPSSSGKTILATECMINAQRMGGVAIFIDWEKSFDAMLGEQMGLNLESPYWIYKRPRTWEEGNLIATRACEIIRNSKAIPEDAPILVVFDSIAAAIPKSCDGKSIDELTMNDTSALARVTSTTLKNQAQYCADFNATFVYLNQIREKLGVIYGDKTTTPGGKAMEFYATVRLSLTRKLLMAETGKADEKELVGQQILVKCTKSKLTKPFKQVALNLAFDEFDVAYFDKITSMIEHLVLKKILDGGAWIEFDGKKHQGKKKLAEYILTNGKKDELFALILKLES